MCSRYALISPAAAVQARFDCRGIGDFPPRHAIAPTEPVAIVRNDFLGRRELRLVRWGLIPPWVKDPAGFGTLFSARAETAADKPSFRGALRHRRCVVPADGYWLWSGPPRRRKAHRVWPSAGGLLALAGLWEHWLGADGSEIETMAILTVAANAQLSGLDDRMPAILQDEDLDTWLDCRSGESTAAQRLLRTAPDDMLRLEEAVADSVKSSEPR